MVPHVPPQRQHASPGRAFNQLVSYIEENQSKDKSLQLAPAVDPQFADLIDYATTPTDKVTNVDKCLAIRTHGVIDIAHAAAEMNAVASKNYRCKDPGYHFILSWPEHELPPAADIFDAAEHALKALGLADHQYVLAIHGNTDNRHCHVAVNRVHPVTFKTQHLGHSWETLHLAARQSEIKHGWSHDNGLFIVERDDKGIKTIVANRDYKGEGAEQDGPGSSRQRQAKEQPLPSWHDPESLESWLKTSVARPLKRDLPKLQNWAGLHAWLDKKDITLTDTGGGGMRVHVVSPETGEILELPASKGLRILKRADLEARWGQFQPAIQIPCIVPDVTHLTPQQLAQGATHVIDRTLDFRTPLDDLFYPQQHPGRNAAERTGGMHAMPDPDMDAGRADGQVLLPNAVPLHMGDARSWQDQDLRRPGAGSSGSSREGLAQPQSPERGRHRNDAAREQRKEERARARADLRSRYATYKRFIRLGDTEKNDHVKALQAERRRANAELAKEAKEAKRTLRQTAGTDIAANLLTIVGIDTEFARRKLAIEARYQHRVQEQRATHQPPLGWREWLVEQANLADQAAISALRGIVYQAQRDAKRDAKKDGGTSLDDQLDEERAATDSAYRDAQYKKVIARLLEEEKHEIAIRAARSNAMRPHEIDSLLRRYAGIQFHVTGNGNIEFRDRAGGHLFTDRGNRVTFDRARVTDEEIKLALIHAQQKFGRSITLTGTDLQFTARMARLADDMNLVVLNPEMQTVIAEHRKQRKQPRVLEPQPRTPPPLPAIDDRARTPADPMHPVPSTVHKDSEKDAPSLESQVPAVESTLQPIENAPQSEPAHAPTLMDHLRAKVLAIDPHAVFIQPDVDDVHRQFIGLIAVVHQEGGNKAAQAHAERPDPTQELAGFAQHLGRHQYALHASPIPEHDQDTTFDVRYRDRKPAIKVVRTKGKGRTD